MKSRLETWTFNHWNIMSWVIYRLIFVRDGVDLIPPDKALDFYSNYHLFLKEAKDYGISVGDLRGIGRLYVKKIEANEK